ncbi:MAG: TspO/MBR family protein [Thermoplasmatota archaeon]
MGLSVRDLGMLALFALGTLALGTLSGLSSIRVSDEYQTLEAPSWAPPSWLFGPVWTVLYLMVGTAAWMAWRTGASARTLGLWGAQLAVNLAWTPLFFGLGERGWALVDIVVMLALIVATILAFYRTKRRAAWLLVPYALWVAFATALNAAFWWLNR